MRRWYRQLFCCHDYRHVDHWTLLVLFQCSKCGKEIVYNPEQDTAISMNYTMRWEWDRMKAERNHRSQADEVKG